MKLLQSALVLLALLPASLHAQQHVIAWGLEYPDHWISPPTSNDLVELAVGGLHAVAIREDSSLLYWGEPIQLSAVPQGTGFVQVAAGARHSMALASDGSIVSWGGNTSGVVSSSPAGNSFTDIAAGAFHSLALRTDGSIVAWGQDEFGQVSAAPTGTGFIRIAGGSEFSMALRADGSITVWGRDNLGQVKGVPTGPGYTKIAGGQYHAVALHSDGSVITWGDDSWGQTSSTPVGGGFVDVQAGFHISYGMRANGSVVGWGFGSFFGLLSDIPEGRGFSHLRAHDNSVMVLAPDNSGTTFCFGDGSGATCPCGAGGANEGCGNSAGNGASLEGAGHAALTDDDFRILVNGVPGNQPGLLLRGLNSLGSGNPAGEGLLCVGGLIARSQVQVTNGGSTTFTDFQGSPFGETSWGAGQPTYYQFWYRDAQGACSGSGANFTNALRVDWLL